MNGIDMTVNRLPARTWNWLKVNEVRLADVRIEGACPVSLTISGNGVRSTRLSDGDAWERIATGMGLDMDALLEKTTVGLLTSEAGGGEDGLAVVEYMAGADGYLGNRLYLHAEKDSELNVVVLYRATVHPSTGLAALQTKVHVESGAKVRLYMAQILPDGMTSLNDIGVDCEAGASFELIRLELGAGKAYAGCEVDLKGTSSGFQAGIGYAGRPNQKLDMNYTVRHRGKKTESLMEVTGVLANETKKLFRGTIDFLPGCGGAKGTETEDVLLLGDRVVNQTVPLILCAEEDVEGNHGATIGRLDETTLFYLESRGIPKEEAEQMMARAKTDALCAQIPSKKVRDQIQAFLCGAGR
ncbi:MAG: SufD family Fe-S cluster assembly protein [Clostridiales bacterium]|nr:SufD family Fe-S cluster assembly protein [Clostridiales bacterium]